VSKRRRNFIIVLVVLLFAALLFMMYKLFSVRGITVQGAEDIDASAVTEMSGIQIDQSVFLIDKQAALDAIDADPLLKAVSVQITYPDRVTIIVAQRAAAAYVLKEDVLLVVDKECFLLNVVSGTPQTRYPVVSGLKMDTFEVGERVGAHDTFQLDVLERVLTQMEQSDIGVTEINVTWAANIILQTDSGFSVEIGDDTQLEEKFNLAIRAIEELQNRGLFGGVLDVSAVGSAYYQGN